MSNYIKNDPYSEPRGSITNPVNCYLCLMLLLLGALILGGCQEANTQASVCEAATIPGKFHFLCEDYTENLTFTLVEGGVRNCAGTNEQFCGAVNYDQSIRI